MKIPATQLIQVYELTKLEKEKEILSHELNDCKAKLLKLVGEQNKWEMERGFLIAKIYVLNENPLVLEREREEKNKKELVKTKQEST